MSSFQATPFLKFHQVTVNGEPLAGGKLYTYVAGSLDEQPTYIDADGSAENTNPVVLDSSGEANVFLDDTLSYYLELYDAEDNLRWSQDNITTGTATGGSPVYTTGDQEIDGVKIFHDIIGFGNGDTAEYETANYPVVIGDQATTITGIQFVATGLQTINFGTNEQGSNSTLAGMAYSPSTQTLTFRRGGASTLTLSSATAAFAAPAISADGVAVRLVTDVVAIAQGGTGQVTANAAVNALLPSQTSESGKYLKTDGTNTSWALSAGGPQFLAQPFQFFTGTSQPTWTTYDVTAAGVPTSATRVIIEAYWKIEGQRNPITQYFACLRVDNTKGNGADPQSDTFVLASGTRGRDSNIDACGGSQQGTFPLRVDHTFDYVAKVPGLPGLEGFQPLVLRIVGYY